MNADEIKKKFVKHLGWSENALILGVQADFCCEYCGRDLLASIEDYDSWQIDHIIPNKNDDRENLAVSCKTCNFIKRRWDPSRNCEDKSRDSLIRATIDYIEDKRKRKSDELKEIRNEVRKLRYSGYNKLV